MANTTSELCGHGRSELWFLPKPMHPFMFFQKFLGLDFADITKKALFTSLTLELQ